jgi:hypothetical protein
MNLYWVTYDPENGDTVPDAKSREYVDNFIASDSRRCSVGSERLLDEFRMLVVRGVVQGGQIRVGTPTGAFHPINENAVLVEWPCEHNDITSQLLMFACRMNQKRKAEGKA